MKTFGFGATALSLIALSATGAFAQSRDQIRIVGSSTVFPYTQAVAEEFSNQTGAPAPIVESTGTGGGMQVFCSGVGENTPDLTGASRAMTQSEYDLCVSNGVTDITEALIGYDGLVIAVARNSEADWNLTLEQVYLALAAEIVQDGQLVANPYTNWSEIDDSLPEHCDRRDGAPSDLGHPRRLRRTGHARWLRGERSRDGTGRGRREEVGLGQGKLLAHAHRRSVHRSR